ncbi:hypothetical protein Achl_3959 (plasmid) [Pseudarthrobacter chlorophenolicus A6]|uniref:Peptidase M10 metallopeptidase domain-containing protein n=1 Tax=Pseudarthrobacter chlorophenolicus (strain ATCC 700700 / DSM 12829 / CIP 107037 / JCM 12360 / KCTC 9906 / NCIMB 13794 / A6) TaxID=452863 RepID=B8HHL3_PSECP|nr:matrixin family metalloprotease [Pseudarthrobacter chlorophenolicus]ACL41910.1 hypothetical protein Achl_3959 [Pseudarthrobacter chlorophenolicus A6]SDQ18540.1 Matrixin [Pseudarthrobacter chlorophenolicus]
MSQPGREEVIEPWQDSAAYRPPVPRDGPAIATARPPRKRARWITAGIALTLAAAAGAAYVVTGPHSFASLGAQQEAYRHHWPTPHRGGTERLAPAVTAAPDNGYTATRTEGGVPVGYDPCDAIHYVIREENAPAGGDKMIEDAVAKTARATGLVFIYDGTTEEPPSADREKYQPGRYGDRWAPVLISWTTPDEMPSFIGDAAGFGGSSPVQSGQAPWVYVTGQVQMDGPAAGKLIDQGSSAEVEAILLHEMGHVVGLGHAEDKNNLMYRSTDGTVADFGPGDLAGLAKLGNGPCVPEY